MQLDPGLSIVGVLVGTVFLSVSLSPSLLPRPFAIQGVLSGLSFAAGYGLGVAGLGLWRFMQLPVAGKQTARRLSTIAGALEELKRIGGFDKSALLLVTPTGTGWVDPAGQNPVEYLFRGDIASVAVQYSCLNSPLALLTQAAYGAENARAVFVEIYGYWRSLPADQRPKLYLSGLSLGSLNSDLSFDLFDIIDEPFNGALWSGPPFRNESWRRMTRDQEPGSPAWLPRFRNGTLVRFMSQTQGRDERHEGWGDFRIIFLQYASDPITFFDYSSAWREPAWLREPRGPYISPDLRCFPVVTMLQLAADMVVGTAPQGFGHEYASSDYLDAWIALTRPEGWTAPEIERLRLLLE